jgi:hypothetical protein
MKINQNQPNSTKSDQNPPKPIRIAERPNPTLTEHDKKQKS